ncbi:unnamed protein product [Hermetia illucens]|uniref:Uncharacterized protein n=1 Tax=Hermetia illucens TaxID=343691 RepID=A0A7R8Z1Y6_HERIL|nr:unnamed protein product [Hermetia illucens]
MFRNTHGTSERRGNSFISLAPTSTPHAGHTRKYLLSIAARSVSVAPFSLSFLFRFQTARRATQQFRKAKRLDSTFQIQILSETIRHWTRRYRKEVSLKKHRTEGSDEKESKETASNTLGLLRILMAS